MRLKSGQALVLFWTIPYSDDMLQFPNKLILTYEDQFLSDRSSFAFPKHTGVYIVYMCYVCRNAINNYEVLYKLETWLWIYEKKTNSFLSGEHFNTALGT